MDQDSKVQELKSKLDRPVALVGLMGAGKTTVGRRLGRMLGLTFLDADREMEKAAGRSLAEILEAWGEDAYRSGERRVIRRLINSGPSVIATGGGAFEDPETRRALKRSTITVWLNADVGILHSRAQLRPDHRPLLDQDNARSILEELARKRAQIFGATDIEIISGETSREEVAGRILTALHKYLNDSGTGR
jgi:shikimate kinase